MPVFGKEEQKLPTHSNDTTLSWLRNIRGAVFQIATSYDRPYLQWIEVKYLPNDAIERVKWIISPRLALLCTIKLILGFLRDCQAGIYSRTDKNQHLPRMFHPVYILVTCVRYEYCNWYIPKGLQYLCTPWRFVIWHWYIFAVCLIVDYFKL